MRVAHIFVACYGYCGWKEGGRESTVIDWGKDGGRERFRMASVFLAGKKAEKNRFVCVSVFFYVCVCVFYVEGSQLLLQSH